MKTSQLSKDQQDVLKAIVLCVGDPTITQLMPFCPEHTYSSLAVLVLKLAAGGFVIDTDSDESTFSRWQVMPLCDGSLWIPIDGGHLKIENVREWEPGVLAGTVRILGVLYHVRFMLVSMVEEDDECGPLQVFYLDSELVEVSDAGEPFATIELPGYEGEWIMTMFPECA